VKKAALSTVILLLAVISIGAGVVFTKQPAQRAPQELALDISPERVARGQYLASHVLGCLGCHSQRDWKRYGAPIVGNKGAGGDCYTEADGMPGTVCVPNITPHRDAGIGAWSPGELARAIREGVDRNGQAIFSFMPYPVYRHLGDDDLLALLAYLATLPADPSVAPASDVNFPVSFFIKLAPIPLTGPVTAPPANDRLAYGKYLTTIAGCRECHTPVDDRHAAIAGKDFAGGQDFRGPWGTVRSSNITPHATGIAALNRADFIKRFKGFRDVQKSAVPVDPKQNTVMPWLEYAGMTDDDLGAIYDYLRTVPPIESTVVTRPSK